MEVTFPKYLNDLIFKDFGGIYVDKWNNFNHLDNTAEDNKKYIGTYFPRSLAESYIILEHALDNPIVKEAFRRKNKINILDIGSGTGGNLIGLIDCLIEKLGKNITINIKSIDGNQNALDLQCKIIDKYFNYVGIGRDKYDIRAELLKISSPDKFISEIKTKLPLPNCNFYYDIIISSKFFSEFYNISVPEATGLYRDFAALSSEYLSPEGLALVIDITSGDMSRSRSYTSFYMNKELREYISENDDKIKYILPRSCALWYKGCINSTCFTQELIVINHSRKTKDKTKICFALLGKPELADKIVNEYNKNISYITCFKENKKDGKCTNGKSMRGIVNESEHDKSAFDFK